MKIILLTNVSLFRYSDSNAVRIRPGEGRKRVIPGVCFISPLLWNKHEHVSDS